MARFARRNLPNDMQKCYEEISCLPQAGSLSFGMTAT